MLILLLAALLGADGGLDPEAMRLLHYDSDTQHRAEEWSKFVAYAHEQVKIRDSVQFHLSVLRCYAITKRDAALAEIKEEKAGAKLGGVIDMDKMYGLQGNARAATKALDQYEARLRKAKMKRDSCGDSLVRDVVLCRVGWHPRQHSFTGDNADHCAHTSGYPESMVIMDLLSGEDISTFDPNVVEEDD